MPGGRARKPFLTLAATEEPPPKNSTGEEDHSLFKNLSSFLIILLKNEQSLDSNT